MNQLSRPEHLSRITTLWSVVRRAHSEDTTTGRLAQAQLVEQYAPAVHRYLLRLAPDADVADDLFQQFALKVLTGGFHRADAERGRFRDYVKTAVIRMVKDYFRRRPKVNALDTAVLRDLCESDDSPELDETFRHVWRDELLERTWDSLLADQRAAGHRYYDVLRLRSEHPDATSSQLAEQLATDAGITPANIRKILQRARERFADLMLDEVSRSLQSTDPDAIEQELIALDLHAYCRSAMQKRQSPPA